jgi:hypothetical protein
MKIKKIRDKANRKLALGNGHMLNSSLNFSPVFLLYGITEMNEENTVKAAKQSRPGEL